MTTARPDIPGPIREAIDQHVHQRNTISSGALQGADSLVVADELTALTDAFIVRMWREAASEDIVSSTEILALGGYGRGELAVCSDIDIVIEVGAPRLLDTSRLGDSVERFLTWCRDARLQIGHAVRTAEQTRREFESDPRTPISVLDSRPLGVTTADWDTVRAPQAARFLRGDDHGINFVHLLMHGYRQRVARNGKTVYLLEPDVKSGVGGLRDLNCLHWAGRVRWGFVPGRQTRPDIGWTDTCRQAYLEGLGWILGLRHLLHINHDREYDRLTFPDQETIADALLEAGDDPGADPNAMAERLVRRHYREARNISMLTQRILRRWQFVDPGPAEQVGSAFYISQGQIGLVSASAPAGPTDDVVAHQSSTVRLTPRQVFEALEQASHHKALLDPFLEVALVDSVAAWGPKHRRDPELNQIFRDLLTAADTSPKTSHRLLETGILTHMLPEFGPIVCHVQHDVYHVYTTDIHSLKCLETARRLTSSAADSDTDPPELFGQLARRIDRTDLLLLAALFHDIGKNRGGDHSRRGADIIADIGPRLGLEPADVKQLAFLVGEHLTLSDTARRRDLSDPQVLQEIADRVETVETLDQLTALTYCDMATVGPNVMTDWNTALIAELYRGVRRLVKQRADGRQPDRQTLLDKHLAALRDLRNASVDEPPAASDDFQDQLDAFIGEVPDDHIATAPPEAVARQFDAFCAARRNGQTSVRFTPMFDRGVTEVIVCTKDIPGTLAKIAGIISACGLNIMDAQIVTTADRRTLDIFQVSQARTAGSVISQNTTRAPTAPDRLDRLEAKLLEVLDGDASVQSILKQRISETRLEPRPTPAVATSVDGRQDVSDELTVIEVRAPDRLGLLYEIARTLFEHDVTTLVSKVDSLGTQIIDIFYVEAIDGGKLTDDQLGAVLNALAETAETSPYLDGASAPITSLRWRPGDS